ncbi:MAG: hypothetical protein M1823_003206 [Watsoniomyces obsoletus]|nr:MAG: hypothetical protein M1823_003206 [Watsoniomyces obsoletus]
MTVTVEASDPQTSSTGSEKTSRNDQPWTPSSWTSKPIKQDVIYEDREAVDRALTKLAKLPPLVTPTENAINSKIKLLLQMSLVLIWGANKPVVRIARMAGQFAKPRSSPFETINGQSIPSFRGDNVNGFDPSERKPDPSRLVSAYFHSAATLNHVRAQLSSGIADLHNPLDWDLGHVESAEIKAKYSHIVQSITESLGFMKTVGADTAGQLQTVDLYTSHEGLLLEYEQSLTRLYRHPQNHLSNQASHDHDTKEQEKNNNKKEEEEEEGWYNTSAHFLWIGDRTRHLDGAHVEYFRGLQNPIGIKVGPSMSSEELISLLNIVNPSHEIGKITLITRYGYEKVKGLLPGHIKAVQSSNHIVVWQCDPMHGYVYPPPTLNLSRGKRLYVDNEEGIQQPPPQV